MRKVLVFAGFLIISFPFSVSAQDHDYRYKFKKNQVLRYEHKYVRTDTIKSGGYKISVKQSVKILEFEILEVSKAGYKINMQIISSFGKTKFLDGYETRADRYETVFDSTAYTLVNYADQGRNIIFDMDFKGEVQKVYGIPEFQEEVTQSIHARGRQSLKLHLRYEFLLSRISEGYYTQLINEVFPNVTEILSNNSTTIPVLNQSGRGLKVTTSWNIVRKRQASRLYFNNYFEADNEGSNILWAGNGGEMFWNNKHHRPDSLVSNNSDIQDILRYLWDIDYTFRIPVAFRINEQKSRGSITSRYVGGYFQDYQNALIVGDIHGCDSCMAIVRFPSRGIKENEELYTINDKSQKIIIPGDLPNGPGLVTIYFPEDYDRFVSYENDPRQIRIYVRPGDTVNFSVDLRRFGKNLEFSGKTWREQEILNSYILGYSLNIPMISIEDIWEVRRKFEKEKSAYCEEFRNWFDFELRYEELELRLDDLVTDSGMDLNYSPIDSLNQFLDYSNVYEGYSSTAYRRFILRLVYASNITNQKFGLGSNLTVNLLETASAVLHGWDRYYVLARLTLPRLDRFYKALGEKYYRYFIQHYKGSEFADYLEAEWQKYERILPGERVDNIQFQDILGDNYNLRDFAGRIVFISAIEQMPKRMDLREIPFYDSLFRPKLYTHICYYIGQEPANKDTIVANKRKNQIWITEKKSVERFSDYFANRHDISVILDKDQRIAYYNEYGNYSRIISYPPVKLNSWPQIDNLTDPPKTINRFVLWYTSTGLVTLAIFLFIVLRVRSNKREARQALNRKMAELELGAVRSRMNPHFLFNALSSIQNLVNGNEIEKANLYLADFGDLVRSILNQSSKNQISLTEEIDTLKTYLDLEQLRFPFKYSIEVDEKIIPEKIEIPPLFIQPHVENAIIHGLAKLGKDGELRIRFNLKYENLVVIVEDNGEGFQSGIIESNGLGQGWKLTKQRVQLLKEQWGKNISVEMMKVEGKSGMRVKFVIPVENKA